MTQVAEWGSHGLGIREVSDKPKRKVIEKVTPKLSRQVVEPKVQVTPKASGAGGIGKGSVSTDKAKKKFVEQEMTVLSGEASVASVDFSLRAKGTVKIAGVGKILSGKYFVEQVKISISSSMGASQTLHLVKNGFIDGATAKVSGKTARPGRIEKSVKHKTHIVRKGETLAKIAQLYRVSQSEIMKMNKAKFKTSSEVAYGMELIVG